MYYQLTPTEQRAHDKAESERMQALRAAILAECKPVEPKGEEGTEAGRQALEDFIQQMNERAAAKPNPLLLEQQS
jgi:hypothetical protein